MDRPTERRRELTGFGLATRSAARVVEVDEASLPAAIKELPRRGGIMRGLGRSYGDPAQNGGGHVLRLRGSVDSIVLDTQHHTVTVGAGVSIDDLLRVIVPRGYFVPVTPGTRYVTIGGAVASDIHGKNHHLDGSFGNHVTSMRMMLADATFVEIGPDRDPELFWATIGGMGLTGVIVDVTFRVLPVETSRLSVDTYRLGSLDEVMAEMVASEADFRYSVAWLDLLASGKHLGRGVLTNGVHATVSQLAPGDDPYAYTADQIVDLPPVVPPRGVINRLTVKAFNEVWYRKAPRRQQGDLQTIPTYFHPLDLVGNWNRVYGSQGFVQYQFVVPYEAESVLRSVVEQLAGAQLPIFMTVLKRFGPGNLAPLSFPSAGWQLAIDIGVARPGVASLLDRFDAMVLDAGGRHYLAKDAALTPEAFRRGYPRLDEWRATRRRVDPAGVWSSDQSRRLMLT